MSYILDALRRADSERERERGAIPSLHTKPVPETFADADDSERSRPRLLRWAVTGLSVVLVAVLAWQFMGRGTPEAVPMPAAAPAMPAPVAIVQPTPAPEPMPVAAPVLPVPPLPLPTEQPQIQQIQQQPASRKATRVAAKPSAPASAVAQRPVYAINELPEDIRRELPPLNVGGAMYSENAASRMLIINGQVFHEGDKVSANLVLEQIKLKAAVLAYKGYRYGISY